jgi:hypothetical protein
MLRVYSGLSLLQTNSNTFGTYFASWVIGDVARKAEPCVTADSFNL